MAYWSERDQGFIFKDKRRLIPQTKSYSEAASWIWIAEFAIPEVSHRDRYQKSWRRLEEKYAAKASADVDALRSKISKTTDHKGWKPFMGTDSSCINQLKTS
jgi:hypothetical protein